MKKYSAQKDQNKKKYNISENRENVLSFLSSVMEMSSQALPLLNIDEGDSARDIKRINI